MGMAKLNVWVSGMEDPCSIESSRTWYVTVYNCDGHVLEWCGRRYVAIPTRCGHLEIEVPPGCYRVNAVWSFQRVGPAYYVNHLTESAIVQACCDEVTCVTLFNPSAHRCGIIYLRAINDLLLQRALKPEVARAAEEAIKRVLESIPRPLKGFELDHLDELERLVREQEGKQEGQSPAS